jgi:separase
MPPLKPPLPPPSPCQIITQSLSPNSCSSSTVNLLNETLFPRAAASATAGGKTPSAQLTSKKLVATRAQQTTSDSSNAPLLSVIDRSRLAIEVINSILRTLSDITKSTVTRLYPPSPSVDKLRTQVAGRLGTKVLQSRSGNSSDSALGSTDTIDHLADCCSISISFLISMESTEGVPNMQPLQTENARLSLSSKLIQLGRFERALNELKKLKWRLQLAMDIGNGIESWLIDAYDTKEEKMAMQKAIGKVLTTSRVGKENAVHVDSKAESEELSTLLEFPHISASSSAFPLVISFQLGVMRCITGLKRVEVIEVTMIPH